MQTNRDRRRSIDFEIGKNDRRFEDLHLLLNWNNSSNWIANLCIGIDAFSPIFPTGINEIRHLSNPPHPAQICNICGFSNKHPITQWINDSYNKDRSVRVIGRFPSCSENFFRPLMEIKIVLTEIICSTILFGVMFIDLWFLAYSKTTYLCRHFVKLSACYL
jgi:hypothetical protein